VRKRERSRRSCGRRRRQCTGSRGHSSPFPSLTARRRQPSLVPSPMLGTRPACPCVGRARRRPLRLVSLAQALGPRSEVVVASPVLALAWATLGGRTMPRSRWALTVVLRSCSREGEDEAWREREREGGILDLFTSQAQMSGLPKTRRKTDGMAWETKKK
jgi:hypothetical protein